MFEQYYLDVSQTTLILAKTCGNTSKVCSTLFLKAGPGLRRSIFHRDRTIYEGRIVSENRRWLLVGSCFWQPTSGY